MSSKSIAIDSEAIRARSRNNCFSKIQLVGQKKNIKTKLLSLVKARQNVIQPTLFWFSKPALFVTSGL